MVNVIQGILNKTLQEAYLSQHHRSDRKQRNVKQTVRMVQILRQPTRPSIEATKR
ncbi:hypothetical protein J2S13_002687 [Oikeobacillus pervagus]|uniref:Uncharacterized protein n=1 Tax=Oikeobacillus pervagus TaxID=1325931 RepID=A0AAJ1T6V7_9BACI|nr:hypothetical protein [Oikeobacillus pervagus]